MVSSTETKGDGNSNERLVQQAESELVDLINGVIARFPKNFEQRLDQDGDALYLKIDCREISNEVLVRFIRAKKQKGYASTANDSMGDLEDPDLLYKIDITLKEGKLSYLRVVGQPLPKTTTGVFLSLAEALRGRLFPTGKVNARVFTGPVRDDSAPDFLKIFPQIKHAIEEDFSKFQAN